MALTHTAIPRKRKEVIIALGVWLVVALSAGVLGAVHIPPSTVAAIVARKLCLPVAVTWPPAYEIVLLQIRLPRVLLGSLVGASLALAGATFQGLLRNPLAGPYILGVSSGASLGAVLAMTLGLGGYVAGLSGVPLFAFAGALATIGLVYLLGQKSGRLPIPTLLLAGVALSSFLSSWVSLIVLFSGERIGSILFWLMGGLSGADWRAVRTVLPYFVLGGGALMWNARALNALAFGEDAAGHLGVEVEKLKRTLVFAASLLTAAAVATSGVIGFVGLVTPHVVRLLRGPDHRGLISLSAVIGATFLVAADTLARTVLAPQELPVGAITALCGTPFFIHLLRHQEDPW